MVKIITTNSYYNIFNLLVEELKSVPNGLGQNNFVFCEEKSSLMTERAIASFFNGSFSTFVYSFGNYYAVNKRIDNVISKEGASMIVRKVLSTLPLKTFRGVGQNLAPSIFELIIQLKSASVKPSDLFRAEESLKGTLKNKIADIRAIYSAYEEYIKNNGIYDQSAQLDYLPDIIENDEKMQNASVFLVGFQGFTAQIKNAVKSLIKKAKDVTFILPNGENNFAFVNESKSVAISLCEEMCKEYQTYSINSDYVFEAQYIVDNLFSPKRVLKEKIKTDKIYTHGAITAEEEARKVAGIIRNFIINKGARYQDFTIACTNVAVKDALKKEFIKNEIPCALDDRKSVDNHPLVRLILSYIEVFRKNKDRVSVLEFIKNPLVSSDKEFNDRFINYTHKYNINYSQFTKPFIYETDTKDGQDFENFRAKICDLTKFFDVENLLLTLSVKEKLDEYTLSLKGLNAVEVGAVNEQVYRHILRVLNEIKEVFSTKEISLKEYKDIFLSGISALKISILPQLSDAVFVGDFKECAMAKNKYLFLLGLDENVPNLKGDVAILTDADLSKLDGLKVFIEPKIKIVNHRLKEQTLLATALFTNRLYAFYHLSSGANTKGSSSEIVNFLTDNFTVKRCDEDYEYLTVKSGLRDFAIRCGDFAYGRALEMGDASCYYELNKELCKKIVNYSNKDIAPRLDGGKNLLSSNTISPTTIEEYYTCPYKFFISRTLLCKEREEGVVNALSIGNFIHEIFSKVVVKMDEISNETELSLLVEEVKNELFKSEVYSKFLHDSKSAHELMETVKESQEHLVKMFKLHKNSLFKSGAGGVEVKFGKNGRYPEIPLLNGKVSLSGKIDRVDTYGDYARVIDYKTGKIDDSKKGLYSGTKLQLFLYGLAVNDKKLAGAYYMPIKSGFLTEKTQMLVGKTLDEQEILEAQDKNYSTSNEDFDTFDKTKLSSSKNLNALVEYSKVISEKAVKLMEEGFILPAPFDKTCDYCEYKAFCINREGRARTVKSIKEDDFAEMIDLETKDE